VITPCLVLVAPDVLSPAGLALPNRPRLFSKNRTDHIKLVFKCTLETRHFLAHPFSSSLKGAFGKFLSPSSSCRPLHKLEVRYWLVTSAKILPQPAISMEKGLEGFWVLEGLKHHRIEVRFKLSQLALLGFDVLNGLSGYTSLHQGEFYVIICY
jgi:hypothetical protein